MELSEWSTYSRAWMYEIGEYDKFSGFPERDKNDCRLGGVFSAEVFAFFNLEINLFIHGSSSFLHRTMRRL